MSKAEESMSEIGVGSATTHYVLLTPDGDTKLRAELEQLTTIKRAEISQRLRDSMDHGEFSEDNNELDEVKFEQAMVETRIAELKSMFAGAHVIDLDTLSTDEVMIGSYVTVSDPERKIEFEVRVVSSFEADPENDFISIESPMGVALLGAQLGEVVSFTAPAGTISYKISKIRK